MERIVRHYLRENRVNGRILVALSGGADSVALLLALRAQGGTLAAAHLNHCLRGAESDRDEAFVRALCARLDIPLTIGKADVSGYAMRERCGTEEAARRLRYDFLEETADAIGADWIATAHTADDNLETVLFHLVRGTGTRGMAGIPPRRGRIIRPLLCATREEIEAYLVENGQDYVTDSSNLTDQYTRNRIRHQVVPMLREIAPQAAKAALRMSEQTREDADCLDGIAWEQSLARVSVEDGEAVINRHELRDLHDALLRRVLRQTLERLALPMSEVGKKHLEALQHLVYQPGETDLPGGWMACTEEKKLVIFRRPPAWDSIPVGIGTSILPNGRTLTIREAGKCSDVHNPFNTFLADRDRIDMASLSVRRASAADRLEIPESRGARTVRRLCDDHRIPRRMRCDLAVLLDKNGLIAAEGIGLDRSREGDGVEKIEIIFGGQ